MLDRLPADGLTYVLRAVDSLSLSIVTVTVALAMARDGGVGAYSAFLSLVVVGVALGGLLTFVTLNVLRLRAFGLVAAAASGAGRLLLAVSAADADGGRPWLLGAVGLVVSLTSVGLTAMFHSLSSRGGRGLASRTGLLAATATGGVLGTAAAGAVVQLDLWTPLLVAQVAGSVAGLLVAVRFVRAFPRGAVAAAGGGRRPRLGAAGPIAWRVPVIAGVAFSIGSLAPGILADLRGVGDGALAGSVYLLGAVAATLVIRVGDRPPRLAVSSWLGDHRRWFLAAAVGASMWLALPLPLAVCLVGAGLAGVILHLVQAGFEQATAALGDAERAGPSIVVLHSLASVASAVSLAVLPRLMDVVGYSWLVVILAAALAVLSVVDRLRRHDVAPCGA